MTRKARANTCGWVLGSALFVGISLTSSLASAYCRTTTCDPKDSSQGCRLDEQGCVVSGIPLTWSGSCVSYSIHEQGSPLRGISWEQFGDIVDQSFNAWTSSNCGGSAPAFALKSRSPVACGSQEYNQQGANANIWMFRDDSWPYPGGDSTLAITTITYHTGTGEIYDADVEINSLNTELTTSDAEVRFDLQSIVTHEAGHFLGLSHSNVENAAMVAEYIPGTTSLRHLSRDDQAGLCTIYPPGNSTNTCSFDPKQGFATECGGALEEASCSCRVVGWRVKSGLGASSAPFFCAGIGVAFATFLRMRKRRRLARKAAP